VRKWPEDSQLKSAALIDESIQLLKKAETACEEKHILDYLPDGLKELVETQKPSDNNAIE